MTEEQIAELGPAFARFLRQFRPCFAQERTAGHFRDYCRGLLADLPRKSAEPIALAAGTAARTLQEFLKTAAWDHRGLRDRLQRLLAAELARAPGGGVGTVGVVDETSAVKKGGKTPGVQRQYCGAAGKVENCIVTVHLAAARGRFKALLDAGLYLPRSWDQDRPRCREAGIPDAVRYRPKWRIALARVARARAHGLGLDWLTFDEGYGSKPAFLARLDGLGQPFVGEVPRNFACRAAGGPAGRADAVLPAAGRGGWRAYRLGRQTTAAQVWRAKSVPVVFGADRAARLVVAVSAATGAVKYFVTNAPAGVGLGVLLRVAFTRWQVEHCFRVSKTEVGLTHYEGRSYVGLVRHQYLCLAVLAFVALHAERLRGEKPGGDSGAGVPGAERPLRAAAGAAAGRGPAGAHGGGHTVPPGAQPPGARVPTEA